MNEHTQSEIEEFGAELRARLSGELRNSLIDRAISLPLGSQPALARVAYLCQLPRVSISEIARAAAADPSFAATLLRVSNSAASASRFPISDLPTAVTRLGTRMVGTLALAAPTLRLLSAPEDELVAVRRELHRHSIRVGVVARELAPPSIHGETALAAGLVHNVGLGVLSLYAPVGLRRVLTTASPVLPTAVVEEQVFGFTHAQLGGTLAQAWKYPPFLVTAIEEHDRAEPSSALAALVSVADLLVRESGVGVEPPIPLSTTVANLARLVPETARARARWLLAVDPEAEPGRDGTRAEDVSAARLIRAFDELDVAA